MKSTTNKPLACDELRNERQAHMAMQQSKEQVARDRIADRKARTRLYEQLRKERLNDIFWRGVMRFITQMTVVLVAAYMFFNFV